MEIIKPKLNDNMYYAIKNNELVYAYTMENKAINNIYLNEKYNNFIVLHEISNSSSNQLSGDYSLGVNLSNKPKINIVVTNSSASIKIPYTALQNSKVQLFLPNNMAIYNCLRIDNVSDERKSLTSYLLIAEKGLTTTTFRDTEYNLKELENNKSIHSLKMGKDIMKFSITAHSNDCLNEKER